LFSFRYRYCKDYRDYFNPDSLRTLTQCYLEASLGEAQPGDIFQFEREGYFCKDPATTANAQPVFNRTVSLRDSWAFYKFGVALLLLLDDFNYKEFRTNYRRYLQSLLCKYQVGKYSAIKKRNTSLSGQ